MTSNIPNPRNNINRRRPRKVLKLTDQTVINQALVIASRMTPKSMDDVKLIKEIFKLLRKRGWEPEPLRKDDYY